MSFKVKDKETTTHKMESPCGNMYVTFSSEKDNNYYNIQHGKSGGCTGAFLSVISQLMKLCSRYKVPKEEIIKVFSGISCDKPFRMFFNGNKKPNLILSCVDGVGHILRNFLKKEIGDK